MIRIVFESSTGDKVEVSQPGNESWLCQADVGRFPLLSEVDQFSYAVFGPQDMARLLTELTLLPAEAMFHCREIGRLAEHCRQQPDSTLTFTPFAE